MLGFRFSEYVAPPDNRTPFEKLLDIFMELLLHTSGDFEEAFEWLRELDDEYKLTTPDYTLEDFRKDLEKNSYVVTDGNNTEITAKTEQTIRKRSLDQIFGQLKKRSSTGNHKSKMLGSGDEPLSETRDFQFGDKPEQIDFLESFRNAQINHGIADFTLTENDLSVRQTEYLAQSSTVLMIDISHSMILYGEDRITPAKRVALALAELIKIKYPKDTLDVVVFGNDAWQVPLKELPYLKVGPFHTNTVAGLELAMDILRKRRNPNRQIFMITDGKPTCIKEGGQYYKNSNFGFDPKIYNKTINLAVQCRKLNIPVTTFMIASDPYLQKFVEEFTEANNGKAFYSSLKGLGEFIFSDYQANKKRRM
ncbi:MAG: vWA domain-containing protein [Luteibaculaceae bacterium]